MNKSFSPRLNPRQIAHKLKQIAKGDNNDGIDQKVKYIETGL